MHEGASLIKREQRSGACLWMITDETVCTADNESSNNI